jgi:hypothetical protein
MMVVLVLVLVLVVMLLEAVPSSRCSWTRFHPAPSRTQPVSQIQHRKQGQKQQGGAD